MKPTFTLPVVAELELDSEVLASEQRHRFLKIVFGGRRYADLIALNRCLDFLELGFLDRSRDFLRGVSVESHLELDEPCDLVAARRLDVADVEVLHWHAALDEFALKRVKQRLHAILA